MLHQGKKGTDERVVQGGLSFVPFLVARCIAKWIADVFFIFVHQPVFAPSFSTEQRMRMCGWCNLDNVHNKHTRRQTDKQACTQLRSEIIFPLNELRKEREIRSVLSSAIQSKTASLSLNACATISSEGEGERERKNICVRLSVASANQRAQQHNSRELPFSWDALLPHDNHALCFPPTLPAQQHNIWHRPASLGVPHVVRSLILTAHSLTPLSSHRHREGGREGASVGQSVLLIEFTQNNNNFAGTGRVNVGKEGTETKGSI